MSVLSQGITGLFIFICRQPLTSQTTISTPGRALDDTRALSSAMKRKFEYRRMFDVTGSTHVREDVVATTSFLHPRVIGSTHVREDVVATTSFLHPRVIVFTRNTLRLMQHNYQQDPNIGSSRCEKWWQRAICRGTLHCVRTWWRQPKCWSMLSGLCASYTRCTTPIEEEDNMVDLIVSFDCS